MNNELKERFMLVTGFLFLCAGMAMILLVIFTPAAYAADDVYNFYFQKADGPQATPMPSAVPQKLSVSSPHENQDVHRPWEVHAGLAYLNDMAGSYRGGSVGGQFNYSKFLGFSATLIYAPYANSAYTNRADDSNAWDLNAHVVVTPFHIDVIGYNLMQISVLGGTSTLRAGYESTSGRVFKISIGLGLDINFTRQIGTYLRVQSVTDDRYPGGLAQVGMLYRL